MPPHGIWAHNDNYVNMIMVDSGQGGDESSVRLG